MEERPAGCSHYAFRYSLVSYKAVWFRASKI